jgi:tetratricopeptide (TPR) repeat protein
MARVAMSEQPIIMIAEELRQAALAKVRVEQFEDALALYDQALALTSDEETRELITINKAHAMIGAERSGPEVQALPMILMRRRNPGHTFLAAYALLYKHRLLNEPKRSIFYGQLAVSAVKETQNPLWHLAALNELGIAYEINSQFAKAIECFDEALGVADSLDDEHDQSFSRVAICQNLGYNKLLVGETREGIRMIEGIVDSIQVPSSLSDSFIDLCYGYIDLEQYDKALFYGQAGLELAAEERQIRNAHYLLGEAAYKAGDPEKASFHFDELARRYPQFRNLKSLLFAIDIRSMINLKL